MGGHAPQLYGDFINYGGIVACHLRSRFDEMGDVVRGEPCTGHVASVVKSCRVPLDPDLKRLTEAFYTLPDATERKEAALAAWEFMPHHGAE